MTLQDQIIDLYDAEVAKHTEGVKTREAKAAIRDAVVELLAAEPRDTASEAERVIRETITEVRDHRANRIKKDLDYILDYLDNPEEASLIPDPMMHWAIRLGVSTGEDKTLRYWTPEDFLNLGQKRVVEAEGALEAAKSLRDTTLRVVARMRRAGARWFGDLA